MYQLLVKVFLLKPRLVTENRRLTYKCRVQELKFYKAGINIVVVPSRLRLETQTRAHLNELKGLKALPLVIHL